MGPVVVADHAWDGRWLGVDEQVAALGPQPLIRGPLIRVPGTLVPGLRDHHVHLGLVGADRLADSALSAVDDLGWIPGVAGGWRRDPPGGCRVRIAGPFLTAPGGYPSGRSWAPTGSVATVADPAEADRTVAELAAIGVDLVKLALHAAMPVLDDPTLAALTAAADRHRLPVVVHAEGPGQVARAAALRPAALAHAPWTERLPDPLVTELAAHTAWITTLAIHRGGPGEPVAADNLRAFAAAGGTIRYGTDLGNGPGPVGLNPAELTAMRAAGLDATTILTSLCRVRDAGPLVDGAPALTWTPYAPVEDADALPEWLGTLRRCRLEDLEEQP